MRHNKKKTGKGALRLPWSLSKKFLPLRGHFFEVAAVLLSAFN